MHTTTIVDASSAPPAPSPTSMPRPITPRKPELQLSDTPRYWLAGSPAATAVGNGVNLLFPVGERFFVRSVKHFLPRLQSEELKARIRGFFGQEGRHAHAHDEQADELRAQGYQIDEFLARYEQISGWLEERASPELRLAMTAAAEHFTAIMAADALSGQAPLLKIAHPSMVRLLGWHAAEEIEHKAVAYDVLQEVDPRYLRRVQGLAMATLMLAGCWIAGTVTLWRQDGLTVRQALRELRALRADGPGDPKDRAIARRVFARGIRQYLRRDFHPDETDDYHLAREFLAAHGMEPAHAGGGGAAA